MPVRPYQLDGLFTPVSALNGVGPKLVSLLAHLVCGSKEADVRVIDLLFHLPYGLIDRRQRCPIPDLTPGTIATLDIVVDDHYPSPRHRPGSPYRIRVSNDSGTLDLVYFGLKNDWLGRSLPVGAKRIISGRVDQFQGLWQMTHPDYVVRPDQAGSLPLLEPAYPLTQGISNKILRKVMAEALKVCRPLPEWISAARLQEQQWPGFDEAMHRLHSPEDPVACSPDSPARSRLAYDEFFAAQMTLQLMRSETVKAPGRAIMASRGLTQNVRTLLPYQLTQAQERVIAEIRDDLFSDKRMLRLLQGDVGAGKTMVALFAALMMIDAGYQVALMVPTEVLSQQHYATLTPYCEALGLTLLLLTGREKGRNRKALLERLASGEAAMVIGTQALFQDDVIYARLGLVIIDEQHRFGVHQRLALANKGERVDLLVMTATPIPRTLMLAHFGDMETSILDEKPQGRLPIETLILPAKRIDSLVERLAHLIARGERAYWVCPLVEANETLDLVSAEDRFAMLQERLGSSVDLIHGRMSSQEKDRVINRFQKGDCLVLVATTVIEVGVDVPEATLMIIEHAERFGLAQLHQLRGRVGRSSKLSRCLLVYQPPLGAIAQQRLTIMRDTNDGFRIAEEDLKLRGGGEILGTRQSGLPDLRLADITVHAPLLSLAHKDARACLAGGSKLETERLSLACLLHLFRRDAALRLLLAG